MTDSGTKCAWVTHESKAVQIHVHNNRRYLIVPRVPGRVKNRTTTIAVTSECRGKKVICNTWTGTLTNSADPDQTPQNAASDQGLCCLLTSQEVKS